MTFSNTGKAVRGAYVPVNPKSEDGDGIVIRDGVPELINQLLSGLASVLTRSLARSLKSAKSPSQIRRSVINSGLSDGQLTKESNVPSNRFSLPTRILVGGSIVAVYAGRNSMCVAVGSVIVVVNQFTAV